MGNLNMKIRYLRVGFLTGLLYGLGILILEDLTALLINRMELRWEQIVASVIIYPLFFGICGFLTGFLLSIIRGQQDLHKNDVVGPVLLALSGFAVFIFGYQGIAYRILPLTGKSQIFTVLIWGLLLLLIFWLIFRALHKWGKRSEHTINHQAAAIGLFITVLLTIYAKIDYDPVVSAKLEAFDPWWRILVILFSAGLFLMARAAFYRQESSLDNRNRSVPGLKSLTAGSSLIVGAILLALFSPILSPDISVPSDKLRQENDPYNIILIIIDTLRADHTSLLGYGRNTTPWIEDYSSRGVVFTNARSNSSWTIPSVTSFLTSRHPGMNPVEKWFEDLPSRLTTLPEVLSSQGYYTKGVSTNFHITGINGYDRGYDEFTYLSGHSFRQLLRLPNFISNRIPVYNEYAQAFGYIDGGLVYGKARTVNREINPWLKRNSQNRFFLYAHYMDPHIPYYPPKPVHSKGKILSMNDFRNLRRFHDQIGLSKTLPKVMQVYVDRYDDEITYIDSKIKELFETFDELGLWQNTLVILTSDHGEEFLDHGNAEHGHSMYQELVHIPLVIFFPDGRGKGKKIDHPVDLLDLAPTIYEYLGIEPEERLEGVSLLPLVGGELESYTSKKKEYFGQVLPQRPDWKIREVYVTQSGDFKLIQSIEGEPDFTRKYELYNLKNDPGEKVDLSAEFTEVAAPMKDQIERFKSYCDSLRVERDEASLKVHTDEELERLRALGYVQ